MFNQGFTVREPAWHGLATVLDDYPGREEAMQIAGHDFEIRERQIVVSMNEDLGQFGNLCVPKDKWKALVRSDNGELISVVRGSYEVIQNDRLWDIADAIIGQDDVKYETAGVLKDGALLWVLARLDTPSRVKGDDSEIYPYALVSTGHDGTMATKAQNVEVRVVCWNTFQAAQMQAKASGRQFTFRHTKNVMDRIEDAKAALGMIRHQHEEFIQLANDLADQPVSADGVRNFLAEFIPEPRADVLTDLQKKNIDEARNAVRELLEVSPSIPDAHRRTAYGLWSAGVEYLDYYRRANSQESLFRRTVFDTTATKRKMIDLVKAVAA
jgi:phage/plasmid-like protein (TIGR03299 family)